MERFSAMVLGQEKRNLGTGRLSYCLHIFFTDTQFFTPEHYNFDKSLNVHNRTGAVYFICNIFQ